MNKRNNLGVWPVAIEMLGLAGLATTQEMQDIWWKASKGGMKPLTQEGKKLIDQINKRKAKKTKNMKPHIERLHEAMNNIQELRQNLLQEFAAIQDSMRHLNRCNRDTMGEALRALVDIRALSYELQGMLDQGIARWIIDG